MSKKNDNKKTTTTKTGKDKELFDALSQQRNLEYIVNWKTKECEEKTELNEIYKNKIMKLEGNLKEVEDLNNQNYNYDKIVKELTFKLDFLDKEKAEDRKLFDHTMLKLSEEKFSAKRKYEEEITRLNDVITELNRKLQTITDFERTIEEKNKVIAEIQLENADNRISLKSLMTKKEIDAQIKFDNLKKEALLEIEKTMQDLKNENSDQLDLTTKIIMVQNRQLLTEIEYQSEQYIALEISHKKLETKNFELEKDLEIHKEVQSKLAEKNKKLQEKIEKLKSSNNAKNISIEELNTNIHPGMKNIETAFSNSNNNINGISGIVSNKHINSTNFSLNKSIEKGDISLTNIKNNSIVKQFNITNFSDLKIKKLENEIDRKQSELYSIKNKFTAIEEKLTNYENKFTGIFSLYDEGLRRLNSDYNVINNKELMFNIDKVKSRKFENLDSNEKYSLLLVLIKHIIQLVNPEDLQYSHYYKQNLSDIDVKYHFAKKGVSSQDQIFKNANSSQLNFMKRKNSVSSSDNYPLIKTIRVNSYANLPMYKV